MNADVTNEHPRASAVTCQPIFVPVITQWCTTCSQVR